MKEQSLNSNNSLYSDLFGELERILLSSTDLGKTNLNKKSDRVSKFIQNYEYNVSPWPIVISDSVVREFNQITSLIPLLMNKVLRALMQSDPDWLANYLNESDLTMDRFLKKQFDVKDLFIRYDAIVSNSVFKIIELNIGSSVGGWQLDFLYKEIESVFKSIPEIRNWNISYRNISENYFMSMWNAIGRYKGADAVGNIFVFLSEKLPFDKNDLSNNLIKLTNKLNLPLFKAPKIVVFDNLNDLEFRTNQPITCQGVVIDALMIPMLNGDEVPLETLAKLQSASRDNQFIFPDNNRFTLFGNKTLLCLLHHPKAQSLFSDFEQALVDKFVPWSAKSNAKDVTYQNKKYSTEDFIILKQQDLVIKKSHSRQGKDVCIGRSCSFEEWLYFFNGIRDDNDWLLQEYCKPDPLTLADPEHGVGRFEINWGFFGLDGKYAGGMGRGVRQEKECTVINSVRGAIEFVIVEEKKHKKKLTL